MTALIDDIVLVAQHEGADHATVSPRKLHATYLAQFPGATRGLSPESFGATLSYHCINMPARFPRPNNPRLPAPWLIKPCFKRLGWGQYMLLSAEEIERFRQCDRDGNSLIYEREYDVAALPALRTVPPDTGPPPEPQPTEARCTEQLIAQAEALIADGKYCAVCDLIDDSLQVPALRGLLGVALARLGGARERGA